MLWDCHLIFLVRGWLDRGTEAAEPKLLPSSLERPGQKERGGWLAGAQGGPDGKCLFLVHIQANLEDELVKEALKTVRLSTMPVCPTLPPQSPPARH